MEDFDLLKDLRGKETLQLSGLYKDSAWVFEGPIESSCLSCLRLLGRASSTIRKMGLSGLNENKRSLSFFWIEAEDDKIISQHRSCAAGYVPCSPSWDYKVCDVVIPHSRPWC